MSDGVRSSRRWWISILLIVLTPVGLLYVGRPALFLIFFAWKLLTFVAVYVGLSNWFASPLAFIGIAIFDGIAFVAVAATTIWLAVSQKDYRLMWCNHRVVYALATMSVLGFVLAPEFPMFNQKVETYHRASAGMMPTIREDDWFVADQRTGVNASVKAGDVIIGRYAHKNLVPYVQRIVGMPGDRIRLVNGVPEINGSLLRQERASRRESDAIDNVPKVEVKREFLPTGRSYLIARNPVIATNSNTDVVELKDDEFYLLGDNRENSLDSRYPRPQGFGIVRRSEISGVVTGFYWSSNFRRIGKRIDQVE